MRRTIRATATVLIYVVAMIPRTALAGMPSLTLTDVAHARLETISFFLLLILLSAAAVKFLWNFLRADLAWRLPPLTYGKSMALVGLWGALFILVLTMISGARELLTPGAWEKQGATYKLAKDDGKDRKITEAMRRERLEQLKAALWTYAAGHNGVFPADDRDAAIPATLWETPETSRVRYEYVRGRKADAGAEPVVYEPTAFGPPRLVLMSSGEIQRVGDDELQSMLAVAGTTPGAGR